MSHDQYDNPLIGRYASDEMSRIWSPQRKFSTWRRLWVALAEAEAELGLPIQPGQIEAMRAKVDDIDFERAAQEEAVRRHDVMAHVHTFGAACPEAAGVIHLGATSCFVTDNTDLLLIRDSLQIVARRLATVIDHLARFATQYRDMACLGFTHFQPAQPTTVGKRACLWAYDLVLDLEEVEHRLAQLKFRSVKGTTGTQASFLRLFDGDHAKVLELERRVAEKFDFPASFAVTGQTYPRKVDAQVLHALSDVAQSAHKAGSDLRLLQHLQEIEEPFGSKQIGSSAMAYKRNPMRAERMCALARFITSLEASAAQTAAVQWMERTLDDSANRRLTLPQGFLASDAVLLIYQNVAAGLVVHPRVIERRLAEQLPFMATENIMMAAVAQGGDRQVLHERIRQHSVDAANRMKDLDGQNDLLERVRADAAFAGVDLEAEMQPSRFVGRAPEQVDEFVRDVVNPIRARYADHVGGTGELKV